MSSSTFARGDLVKIISRDNMQGLDDHSEHFALVMGLTNNEGYDMCVKVLILTGSHVGRISYRIPNFEFITIFLKSKLL